MRRDQIHFEPRSFYFETDSIFSRYQDRMYYAQMFLEDLGNSIMPIGGRRFTGKSFSVSVLPDEKQYKQKINLLFLSENHSFDDLHSPLEETVSDFIVECARMLVVEGIQHYEIVPALIDPETLQENPNLTGAVFVLLKIPGKVKKFGGVYIQFVPKNLWNQLHKMFVILPASSVWQISIPGKIVGAKSIRETLKGLFIAGGKHRVEMKMLEDSKLNKGAFDVISYRRTVKLYVARLTRSWGWSVRFSLQKDSLQYYQTHRWIVFAYNLAIFREHIFKEMNKLLSKIGYNCHMEMNGLPTAFSISEMFTKLEEKEISFNDAHDLTDIH